MRLLFSRPLFSLFGYFNISYSRLQLREGFVKAREFVSALASTLMPRTEVTLAPIVPATTKPCIFDTFFGITNAVIVDHDSLYPRVFLEIVKTRPILKDEIFDIVVQRFEKLLELKKTISSSGDDGYVIVTPRVHSDFKIADVINDTRNTKSPSSRAVLDDYENERPLRSLDDAILIAQSLDIDATIFRLKDIIKATMLVRIGLAKHWEYNLFTSVLTRAHDIAMTAYRQAREREFKVLKTYIDSYAIEGDKHDAKSFMNLDIFKSFPVKIEAEGTLYLYVPPLYAIVNDGTITKYGLWVVWTLEPQPITRIGNVILYRTYKNVPRIIANEFGEYNKNSYDIAISVLEEQLRSRGREIVIEKAENDKIRIRPAFTRYYDNVNDWIIERKHIMKYALT